MVISFPGAVFFDFYNRKKARSITEVHFAKPLHMIITDIAGFLICSLLIVYSGTRLAKYGDKISELTGIGKAWLGLVLMAGVTSLPELVTGISSVAIIKKPNLAAGDVFGSCVFNLLILSMLDARIKKPLFSAVKSSHILAAVFGIILMTVAGAAIYFGENSLSVLWISIFTFPLIGIYLLAVWSIFMYEKRAEALSEHHGKKPVANPSELRKVIGSYSLNALIVIGSAIFLPYFGEHISTASGLSNSFFGTLFLAASTSMPELVISFAALRIGSLDMAVGNLLGSNLFNMFIIGLDDIFYREGSLFAAISPSHQISIFSVIIMSAVAGLGLLFKPGKKALWLFSLDTFIILLFYILLMTYLFLHR